MDIYDLHGFVASINFGRKLSLGSHRNILATSFREEVILPSRRQRMGNEDRPPAGTFVRASRAKYRKHCNWFRLTALVSLLVGFGLDNAVVRLAKKEPFAHIVMHSNGLGTTL